MEAPENFLPAGRVVSAEFSPTPPPFLRKRRYTGSRARGVSYEKKVQQYLLDAYPNYVASPWLRFVAEGSERGRWCQPDGLIIDPARGIITCVEVKYAHTANAWWQTRQLYIPVLCKIFTEDLWTIQVCEVVRWFDPAIQFPEVVELAQEPGRPSEKFKVHIWRP